MKSLPSLRAYGGWLAIVRILTGVIWLAHGIPKFTQSAAFLPPNGFISTFVSEAMQKADPWYQGFLAGVVQPNIALFAEMVRLGEVLVGISLVLGLFTRLGGLFGVFLSLNYLAAKGHVFSSAALQTPDFAVFLLSLTSLVMPTGRVLGVDAIFTKRVQPAPTVRAEFVPEPAQHGPSAPPNP